MLDRLRLFARTWFGKVLGAFLLVGLAGYGVSEVITSIGTNWVARIGDEEVTTEEFQRAYQSQINAVAGQTGAVPSSEEALAQGIPSQVILRMVSEEALNQTAQRLGLGVSDERLGELLRQDPNFAGTLGNFERANFLRVLQQLGLTENQYLAMQRDQAGREQLGRALVGAAPVPASLSEVWTRFVGDRRTLEYFVINPELTAPSFEPTDAELTAYLTENQERFRAEESRHIQLLALSPQSLAGNIEITEDEVAAEYEDRRASLVEPERRTVEQVNLPNQEAVALFEAGLTAGRPFLDIAAEAGLTPTSLGTVTRNEVIDPNLAEAAFALEQGRFAIIAGIGGQRAVHVSAIQPGGELSLEEAREQISNDIRLQKARNQYVEVLDQIEEFLAAGRPMSEVADRFGLPLRDVVLTRSGEQLAEIPELEGADRGRITTEVFEADPDSLAPSVPLGSNLSVWFDVEEVTQARDRTLEEARDQVAAAWLAERQAEAVQQSVSNHVAEVQGGRPLAEVAAAQGLFPELSQPITRSGDGTGVIDESVAEAAFGGGLGHVASGRNASGDHVVFQVVDVLPAAEPTSEATADILSENYRQTLYAGLVSALRETMGWEINQQRLEQVLALNTGT